MKTTRLEYSLGYKIFSKAEVIGIFVLKGRFDNANCATV